MRSSAVLLLAAAAGVSHAWLYNEDGAYRSISSRHMSKRKTGLDEGSICAPKKIADHIKYQPLDRGDVARVEAMLLSWAQDGSSKIANTGGSKGNIVTSNGVDGQVCNLSKDERHISPQDLMVLFDAINCGPRDQPQMGYGYTDALDDNGFYVGYGPTGQMMDCGNKEKDIEGAD